LSPSTESSGIRDALLQSSSLREKQEKKMSGRRLHIARKAGYAALSIALFSQLVLAENRITLQKGAGNTIDVVLSNSDAVAGAQFSVSACGGVLLRSFEPADRLVAAGIAVYQAQSGDSTLNIVLLAPVRAALPSGEGVIGRISFAAVGTRCADSVRLTLQRVVLCDVAARSLEVSTVHLSWSLDNQFRVSPGAIALEQNYPNPFNPSTTISYRLEQSAHVRLAVYDISGRLVNLLVDEDQQSGKYSVKWNTVTGQRAQLASGIYCVRLTVGGEVAVMKMLLTK
jgi:hypothetical protein